MFLWFLQEKRFLDDKKDYLQQRLMDHVNAQHAISFYRRFLCPLFFRGFAEERTEANRATIRAEFGDVPFLNGGLFARHELEQRHCAALDVADAAFEKLFAFFAQWDWHLDDRPLEKKAGKADKRDPINPDVLGYIFEKFVNQKQMGAYYTKEDITEYIGKNTIIPSVLAKVRAEHPGAFDALGLATAPGKRRCLPLPRHAQGRRSALPLGNRRRSGHPGPRSATRRKPWNKARQRRRQPADRNLARNHHPPPADTRDSRQDHRRRTARCQ
jgi:hypothetical protein